MYVLRIPAGMPNLLSDISFKEPAETRAKMESKAGLIPIQDTSFSRMIKYKKPHLLIKRS